MTCISPPEPTDEALLTYIDGEADCRTATHLEQCPHCRERVRRLARLQDHLTAQLYRITCPSPIELGEYHLGMLPHDQAAAIAQHLTGCLHCTREVTQLKGYLGELTPALELGPMEQIKERTRVLVACLLRGGPGDDLSGQPLLAPDYAGVRGEEEEPYIYQASDIQIVIGIQKDTDQPDRKAIIGLVIGTEPGEVKVHLWQAERRIATVSVDELGNFVIPNLAPGSYELILSSPEVEVHIQDLEVGK